MNPIRHVLAAAALGLTALGALGAHAADTVKTTRFVYFVPADRAVRDDYRQAIVSAVERIRGFYKEQTGDKTFNVRSEVVEICRAPNNAAHYAVDSWTKVMVDAQNCVPLRWDDPDHRWVVYADVRHQCDAPGRLGAGTNGLTIMPEQDLQGLAGQRETIDDCGNRSNWGVERWIGGLGHEFGHALGLPHPKGCDIREPNCDTGSIMWTGYASFPNTYFNAAEREQLRASPFLSDGATLAVVHAASYSPAAVAVDGLASAFGQNLATSAAAAGVDCATTLAGRSVLVTDATGAERAACVLYVGPTQVNFHVPPETAPGSSVRVRVRDAGAAHDVAEGSVNVQSAAPGLFYSGSERIVAGYVVRVRNGAQSQEPLTAAIDLGPATDQVFLVIYGSGVRHRAPGATLEVTLAGVAVEVTYAGPAPGFRGVDQINVRLPRTMAKLAGSASVVLRITEPGAPAPQTSNVVAVRMLGRLDSAGANASGTNPATEALGISSSTHNHSQRRQLVRRPVQRIAPQP